MAPFSGPSVRLLGLIFILVTIATGSPYQEDPNTMAIKFRKLYERPDLVQMIPQQSCYFQSYNNRLTCKCNSTDTSALLDLKMKYYVFDAGNEIRSVHLSYCKEIIIILDLKEVDATDFPFHFKAVRKVTFKEINFEPKYSDRQELQLAFDNVEILQFKKIFVEDTLKIRANNVKEARFINSVFAHIPKEGFQISNAKVLDIRDSTFLNVQPMSIVVEKTKEVTVLKNEMTINALEAVFAKDGSHLMISCNRLTGQPVSPECSKTTTTTTTTTTQAPPPFLINQGNLREDSRQDESGRSRLEDYLPELIGGAIAGVVIITISILLFICAIRKKRKTREEGDYLQAAPIPSPQKEIVVEPERPPLSQNEVIAVPIPDKDSIDSDPKESDSLLDEPEDDKPKFSSPIWLEEIHRNKIFNKQKSLLSDEKLKEIADGTREPPIDEGTDADCEMTPPPPPEFSSPSPAPPAEAADSPARTAVDLNSEDEIKESSRTESDEDFDKQQREKEVIPMQSPCNVTVNNGHQSDHSLRDEAV